MLPAWRRSASIHGRLACPPCIPRLTLQDATITTKGHTVHWSKSAFSAQIRRVYGFKTGRQTVPVFSSNLPPFLQDADEAMTPASSAFNRGLVTKSWATECQKVAGVTSQTHPYLDAPRRTEPRDVKSRDASSQKHLPMRTTFSWIKPPRSWGLSVMTLVTVCRKQMVLLKPRTKRVR